MEPNNEVKDLYEYREETVWRLTKDDILNVLEDKFSHLDWTEQEKDAMLDLAFANFSIYDWTEHVEAFIDVNIDILK